MTNSLYQSVIRYYNQQAELEWERPERHRTEFAMAIHALLEHLPPSPANVLDCSGGPSRYAIELAHRGYEITLLDLSAKNLQLAREKIAQSGMTLAGYEQGIASDLTRFSDATFDAVLFMGPLYHLLDEGDKNRALAEAYRVLVPDGRLFAAFIPPYAPLRCIAVQQLIWALEQAEQLEMLLAPDTPSQDGATDTAPVAHFTPPTKIIPLLKRNSFEVITVLGVGGMAGIIEDEASALSGKGWEAWGDLNYRLAADPSIHGYAERLLAVAVKPRWRTVLRQIVQRLDEFGVEYKVVGGASVALHGVPIPVDDLDLETDAEAAYRFQALFEKQVVRPVALSDSETYRSHFGRFDFGGVSVEVMGDLHRWERERWVPTATVTETVVDLDGVQVCVSWLEEETLAYIRRGRLERAAQTLPYCDNNRLLALLRGEQVKGVL